MAPTFYCCLPVVPRLCNPRQSGERLKAVWAFCSEAAKYRFSFVMATLLKKTRRQRIPPLEMFSVVRKSINAVPPSIRRRDPVLATLSGPRNAAITNGCSGAVLDDRSIDGTGLSVAARTHKCSSEQHTPFKCGRIAGRCRKACLHGLDNGRPISAIRRLFCQLH